MMNYLLSGYCKWAGMFMGMFSRGPRGAIIGFAVGWLLDMLFFKPAPSSRPSGEPPRPASSALQKAYDELGIPPTATETEVREAYRQLAMLYHPDRVAHLSDDVRRTAEQKLKRLNEARDLIFRARGMK